MDLRLDIKLENLLLTLEGIKNDIILNIEYELIIFNITFDVESDKW